MLPGALSQLPAFPPGSFWPCLYLILSLPSINGFFLGMLCCFQEGYNFHFLSSAQRGASDTRQTSRVVSCCSAASFVKNCHYSTSIVPFPPFFLKKKSSFSSCPVPLHGFILRLLPDINSARETREPVAPKGHDPTHLGQPGLMVIRISRPKSVQILCKTKILMPSLEESRLGSSRFHWKSCEDTLSHLRAEPLPSAVDQTKIKTSSRFSLILGDSEEPHKMGMRELTETDYKWKFWLEFLGLD